MVRTYVGPMTDAIIDQITKEIQKKKTKNKIINNILNPILSDITSRYYPHLMGATVSLIIIIVLLLSILCVNLFSSNRCPRCHASLME